MSSYDDLTVRDVPSGGMFRFRFFPNSVDKPSTLPAFVKLANGMLLNLASGSIFKPAGQEDDKVEFLPIEEREPVWTGLKGTS